MRSYFPDRTIQQTKIQSIEDQSAQDHKIGISLIGLLAFLCGIPGLYVVNLIGELYATEIILPFFAIFLLFYQKEKKILKEKLFWLFLISLSIMMVGYILSDLVAGTPKIYYLRAWGRNAFLLSDILSLSIIATTDKRLFFWYIFGFSLGTILHLQITHVSFNNAHFKLFYNNPIIFIIFAAGSFIPIFITILLTFAFGIFSFLMDGRSFGAICLILSGILWIRRKNLQNYKLKLKSLLRITIISLFVILIIFAILVQTNDNEAYSSRRASSSIGRFAAIKIAVIAISDSPVLGFGSWGEGTKKYADMLYNEIHNDLEQLGRSNLKKGNAFLAHSQILQAWMEGGILAAQLFIFYGIQMTLSIKKVIFNRHFDYMTTFYCFILISGLWALIMSPYGGIHRLNIGLAVAATIAVKIETAFNS